MFFLFFGNKKIFGNNNIEEERDLLSAQLHIAHCQATDYKEQIEKLKKEIEKLNYVHYRSDWKIGDPSPEGGEGEKAAKRSDYISRVLAFFADIQNAKIESLIAKATADLSNPLNGRDYDLQIKGVINALSQLLDWRDDHEAEQKSIQQDRENNNQNG